MGRNIGIARARAFEHFQGALGSTEAEHKLFLFDIQMITRLVLSDTPSPLLTATHSTGVRVKGNSSGAIGFVFSTENGADGTSNTETNLVNVSGTFQVGEKLIASDSAETGKLIENSSNVDLTISSIETFKFEDVRAVFMEDADTGQNFTADMVMSRVGQDTDVFRNDGSDENLSLIHI